MSDTMGKTSSCLAITEKKMQRPGGCVGIFFQLFDWNRRLAKKKLFSKKLLPAARANHASKKFKGEEKMPNSKLHLIANENSGGFPSSKKGGNRSVDVEQKHDVRVPGLVARLMGLDSLPAAQRDKFKKASLSDPCGNGEESLDNCCESDGQHGVNFDMGVVKNDSRPQKLQKTGSYERRAVTRFGAEASQIKGVLSRARKHHNHHNPPKLPSPLKSPRISSGKNVSRSSRLIGAATKILEPGLQATSRAKSALTYSGSMYSPNDDIVEEGLGTSSADLQNQSGYDSSTAKPLMGQTSCKSCGNLLNIDDCRSNVDRHRVVLLPVNSDVITTPSIFSVQRKARPVMSSLGEGRDVLPKSQEQVVPRIVEEVERSNTLCSNEPTTRIVHLPRECVTPWNLSHQPCRTLEDDTSSVGFKHNTKTQDQMKGSDRILPGSRVRNQQVKKVSSATNTVSGTKDFVALNRTLSGRTRMRAPTKLDNSKFDLERKPSTRQDDSMSPVRTLERKRRTPNVTQVETTDSLRLTTARQRNVRSDAQGSKRREQNACPTTSTNIKNKRGGQGKIEKIIDNKVSDVVSFAFNSPLKHKTDLHTENVEKSNDGETMTYFQKPLPMTGDVLGAFLEQKLKELTSQEDEELATGAPPKRTTAMILQELITALSAERLTCHDGQMVNASIGFHDGVGKERLEGVSSDDNHFSPGCVLEASFSSSSLDESSVHGFHPDCMNCCYDQLQQLEPDVELLDSATSYNVGKKIGGESLTDLVDNVSRKLQSLSFSGVRLTRGKLNHVKDVILDAELLLGDATVYGEDGVPDLVVSQFLLEELDILADNATCLDLIGIVDLEDSKGRSLPKGFLFDCVIEYLEANCRRYSNCGFKAWTKLPLCMKANMLIQEVNREIKKWACITAMNRDDIIEMEMSCSLGKWTDFDIEAFEAGVEIDGIILEVLLDEVVVDLVDCKQDSI